jgi:hypothetical protein
MPPTPSSSRVSSCRKSCATSATDGGFGRAKWKWPAIAAWASPQAAVPAWRCRPGAGMRGKGRGASGAGDRVMLDGDGACCGGGGATLRRRETTTATMTATMPAITPSAISARMRSSPAPRPTRARFACMGLRGCSRFCSPLTESKALGGYAGRISVCCSTEGRTDELTERRGQKRKDWQTAQHGRQVNEGRRTHSFGRAFACPIRLPTS